MKRIPFAMCAGVLAVAAACGSDSTTSATSLQLTQSDSVAAVVTTAANGTVGDLDVLNSLASSVGFQIVADGHASLSASLAGVSASYAAASGCTLNTSSGFFECPPTTNNGLTLTRDFAFYNAAGTLLTKFNDTTVASINVTTTETGVRPTATGADTVSGSRNMTATGLAGHNTTRTWNGTGSRTVGGYYTDSTAARTYDLVESTTFSSIVVTLPRSSNPYPTSGAITRQINCTATVTKASKSKSVTTTKTVSITFNGTEFVPMSVGSVGYTLDLATGKATKN